MNLAATVFVSIITAAFTAALVVFGLQQMQSEGIDLLGGASSVEIPSVTNLEPEQARVLLQSVGLLMVISRSREDPEIEAGRIVEQSPLSGLRLKKGMAVNVVLSTGESTLQVPGLTGLHLNEAMQKLTGAELRVGAINRQNSDAVPLDAVITSIPVAGSKISPNTPVNLVVSNGKGKVTVPDLIGKRHNVAREMIEKAGLKEGRIRYRYDEDRSAGRVLSQDPRADTEIEPGESVDLVINQSD